MGEQKGTSLFIERIYDKIKKSFQYLFSYTKNHPFISLTYFLIFATGLFFRIFVLQNFGTMQWDEASHSIGGVFISKLFLNGLRDPAVFIESYINDYSGTLGSFWFYPPGYSLLTSVGFLLLGFSDFVARLISLIFSILLIHATVRVAREIDPDEKVALVSAFLVATSSIIVIVGTGAMLDIPQTTLIMYSILFWIRGIKSNEGKAFLKAGILGGLAGLMKPTGIFVLLFMMAFQVLTFITSKDDIILSKRFWKGMIAGLLIFSTWWVSALVLKYAVGDWIGEGAFKGVVYWFDFFGVFGRYIPPWYSPQWYTYEGWTYYANHLIFVMGVLPFLFSIIGVCFRIKEVKRSDILLVLFVLSTYSLQSFASNKNPRYIITCLPILYIYSSIGLMNTHRNIMEFPPKLKRIITIKKIMAMALIIVFILEGLMPLLSAIKTNYTPGMDFGIYTPIQESIQIIENDGSEGIIIPDSEDNWFNVFTLTFYVASIDNERKYGCHSSPSTVEDIFSIKVGDKRIKYVLVHDFNSNVSIFIHSNPESFVFMGKAENPYGSISVYRVNEK